MLGCSLSDYSEKWFAWKAPGNVWHLFELLDLMIKVYLHHSVGFCHFAMCGSNFFLALDHF